MPFYGSKDGGRVRWNYGGRLKSVREEIYNKEKRRFLTHETTEEGKGYDDGGTGGI